MYVVDQFLFFSVSIRIRDTTPLGPLFLDFHPFFMGRTYKSTFLKTES